ncbi:MAG: type II toxin-antitoxin system RelE/ParE family toxin [Leptolyngbyaceae cyanobacterium CRU_2_3]|nr:type II toxin-antitoxin system RelE/ParE family toxin [Leptolyngbyaceae cyanobacterium CRU_2_3]
MDVHPRNLRLYRSADGEIPFTEWLDSLRDIKTQTIINKRLDRVRLGNLGDYRSVGAGVYELRIDHGAGYRIYFGQVGSTIVLLLCGGDKSSQAQDIVRAKDYWANYENLETATHESYQRYLISRLSDPSYAAAYLETPLRRTHSRTRTSASGAQQCC